MPAYRILIRPVFLGQGLIDNRYTGRLFRVRVSEGSALDQRNSHRSQIIAGDQFKLRPGTRFARGRLVSVDDQRVPISVIAHGGAAGRGRRLYAAELFYAQEQVAIELEGLLRLIAELTWVHVEVHNVMGVESQIGTLRRLQAAGEKPGNDQQDQRAAYLNDHQSGSQTGTAADDTASSLVQNGIEIPA